VPVVTNRPILEDRLVKLAAAGLGEGRERRLQAERPEALLRAVLVEIDTLVLPRELRIRNLAGHTVSIEAAERRVLALREFDNHGQPRAEKPVSSEDANAILASLSGLIGDDATIHLSWSPLGRDFDPAETGISAVALSEVWEMPLTDAHAQEAGDAIDTFLSHALDRIRAWVMISGDVSESFGDDGLIEGLNSLAESDRGKAVESVGRATDDPWYFVILSDAHKGDASVLAEIGGTRLLMAVAAEDVGEVADAWRNALTH
jgi:hypothetical protein